MADGHDLVAQETSALPNAADWLDYARKRFAAIISRVIVDRTEAGVEAGFGFVPSAAALQLARTLEDDMSAATQPRARMPHDHLPVGRLIAATGLPPGFADWAALMLLAERDARWGTLFAFLADNAALRIPTVGVLTEIAGEPGVTAQMLLSADSVLLSLAILAPAPSDCLLPDRPMRFAPQLVSWLLGDADFPERDSGLKGFTKKEPRAPLTALLPDAVAREAFARMEGTPRLVLTGQTGSGRNLIARELAGPALLLDAARLAGSAKPDGLLRAAVRDCCLRDEALVLCGAHHLPTAMLEADLATAPITVMMTSDKRMPLEWPSLSVPALGHSRALSLWNYGLGDGRCEIADRIAHQFRLPAADILRVCNEAGQDDAEIVAASCLSHSTTQLDKFAAPVACRHDWEDLVLPPRQKHMLRSIVQRTRHGHQVYTNWGFGKKLAPNRGLIVLFSGPSGAGKTLSASVVARDLGLPLYRIDLSAIVSKYIGETEKQLEEIFNAAEAGSACLFFDECDALFGKRSEVSDAHDRYANIETSYLLQRLEVHRGTVFLATNYPQNIDEAFTRRIDLNVEFSMPDEGLRGELWQRLLPPEADACIDAEQLGRQFELSGGSIRNCLVAAAFLAAEEGARIETRHCLLAVAREYEKTGKPLTRSDFGEAFVLLRPARHGT